MPETLGNQVSEVLSTTVEDLLIALGSGIGRAQAELDRHSIEIQKQILEDPVLSQYGLEATWYQIPKTDLELKIAMVIENAPATAKTELVAGVRKRALPRIWAQPVNARYTNQFSFDMQAATTLKLSVVTVPPPGTAATRPALAESEVLKSASQYLCKDPVTGELKYRVTVNFNGGMRAWYVMQTSEEKDTIQLKALVKVDDDTGTVIKQSPCGEG